MAESAHIAIVGLGPRGLSVLERIVAHERASRSTPMVIHLFDANEPGVGCHDPAQPNHLLVNTVAAQITQFCDSSVVGAGPILQGPSFHEWMQDDRTRPRACSNSSSSPDDYHSRAYFGRYLRWVYHYLRRLAPPHVRVVFVKASVKSVTRSADNSWLIDIDGSQQRVDYVFLTTGHGETNTKSNCPAALEKGQTTEVIDDPYPIAEKLKRIDASQTVAVEGLGLTTFDILAELTVGRGGHFETNPDGSKTYQRSGREPHIVAYSRSGLPLSARAMNQKGMSGQYRPRFLMSARLKELRSVRQLDFELDVLPKLIADMEFAYYEAYHSKVHHDALTTMMFSQQFAYADAAERRALVEHYIPEADRFVWQRLMNPIPATALSTHAEFSGWLREHLRADLQEAALGNVGSPIKAASDVLRDLRDTIRAAVDFGGLTERSHRDFLSQFVPMMNRVAVGPPASRIAEMIALMDAGVLQADLGPDARCQTVAGERMMSVSSSKWLGLSREVHVLVRGRISMPLVTEDNSLTGRLIQAGHIRRFRNGNFHPGGIEVDRNFNWVARNGQAVTNAWSLGIPTEGAKFYTFVVPRSGVNSTALVDAGRAVGQMLSMLVGLRDPQSREVDINLPAVKETSSDAQSHEVDSVLPTLEEASAFASLYGAIS